MPEFHLFPRLKKVGEVISHFVLGPHLFSPVSDHEFNHGAAPMLDRELYDKQPVPSVDGKDL